MSTSTRSEQSQLSTDEYRPFLLADRPNHVRVLQRATDRTTGFGVITQPTVSETVRDLIADLDVPVLVDCGAFSAEEFDGGLIDLFDRYDELGADYGLLPDHLRKRRETDREVAHASRLYERGCRRWSFAPVPVAQGRTANEYAAALWDCYQMGADYIAVGGLLDTEGDRSGGHATSRENLLSILERVREAEPRIWDQTWTFALGCDHPQRRPRLTELGVQAADSKRWLFQYDDALPASRSDQLVEAVVDLATHHSPTLSHFA